MKQTDLHLLPDGKKSYSFTTLTSCCDARHALVLLHAWLGTLLAAPC